MHFRAGGGGDGTRREDLPRGRGTRLPEAGVRDAGGGCETLISVEEEACLCRERLARRGQVVTGGGACPPSDGGLTGHRGT